MHRITAIVTQQLFTQRPTSTLLHLNPHTPSSNITTAPSPNAHHLPRLHIRPPSSLRLEMAQSPADHTASASSTRPRISRHRLRLLPSLPVGDSGPRLYAHLRPRVRYPASMWRRQRRRRSERDGRCAIRSICALGSMGRHMLCGGTWTSVGIGGSAGFLCLCEHAQIAVTPPLYSIPGRGGRATALRPC